jgi:hypothetical protein
MCMYSVTAQDSRDARQGEDLVVTRAPHGISNWLTEAGKSDCAVCVPDTAVLAVQLPNQPVRGASFEQAHEQVPHAGAHGHHDFLNYLDGEKERVALNSLPAMTKVRVLHLFANSRRAVVVPAALDTPTPLSSERGGDLVEAGGIDRRRHGSFSRFFRVSDSRRE